MKIIDAQGLDCPNPVILTKKALENDKVGGVITIVDNEVAKKNVEKLAKSLAYSVITETKTDSFEIKITKNEDKNTLPEPIVVGEEFDKGKNIVILCSSEYFGRGDEKLGSILVNSFFYSLTEVNTLPKTIIFMNSGAKLTLKDSKILDSLRDLETKGCEILTCGTCLNYLNKEEELVIGEITNMYTATEVMMSSDNLITI
ncbi:MAG: sulfurtransferase-like selenium metabolism protein YedF [Clostridia bacterium]